MKYLLVFYLLSNCYGQHGNCLPSDKTEITVTSYPTMMECKREAYGTIQTRESIGWKYGKDFKVECVSENTKLPRGVKYYDGHVNFNE